MISATVSENLNGLKAGFVILVYAELINGLRKPLFWESQDENKTKDGNTRALGA